MNFIILSSVNNKRKVFLLNSIVYGSYLSPIPHQIGKKRKKFIPLHLKISNLLVKLLKLDLGWISLSRDVNEFYIFLHHCTLCTVVERKDFFRLSMTLLITIALQCIKPKLSCRVKLCSFIRGAVQK